MLKNQKHCPVCPLGCGVQAEQDRDRKGREQGANNTWITNTGRVEVAVKMHRCGEEDAQTQIQTADFGSKGI